MNRFFTLSFVVVVAALLTAPAFAADDAQAVEGVIASAADGKMALKVGDEQHNFTVNRATKVTLDGKAAKFDDLKADQRAKVTYRKADKELLALTIDAKAADSQRSLVIAFADNETETHEGTIVSAADDKLAVTVKDEQHNFTVNAQTKITLDGKAAKLSDLKAGQTVKVACKKVDDQHIAQKIEAKSAE